VRGIFVIDGFTFCMRCTLDGTLMKFLHFISYENMSNQNAIYMCKNHTNLLKHYSYMSRAQARHTSGSRLPLQFSVS
jgi:hypothetical protein